MTKKAKILGIQLKPEIGNKDANLEKVKNFIENYSWFKPDLIVLPEVFNSGVDHKILRKLAENIPDGKTTQFMAGLAKKYSVNIVAGSFIEKVSDDEYKNTSVVLGRNGEILGKYQKIHMFDYYGSEESKYVSAGCSANIAETDIGKIGLSVCYDLRFPELYRCLTYSGVDIIINAAAWPYPRLEHWIILNKARAIENTIFIIAVNQCGSVSLKRQNLGMSMIINPWGDVISCAGGDEGVIIAEINFDYIRKIREEFPVLNDRNLDAYRV
jgi:predicted amidohydrolase